MKSFEVSNAGQTIGSIYTWRRSWAGGFVAFQGGLDSRAFVIDIIKRFEGCGRRVVATSRGVMDIILVVVEERKTEEESRT